MHKNAVGNWQSWSVGQWLDIISFMFQTNGINSDQERIATDISEFDFLWTI